MEDHTPTPQPVELPKTVDWPFPLIHQQEAIESEQAWIAGPRRLLIVHVSGSWENDATDTVAVRRDDQNVGRAIHILARLPDSNVGDLLPSLSAFKRDRVPNEYEVVALPHCFIVNPILLLFPEMLHLGVGYLVVQLES